MHLSEVGEGGELLSARSNLWGIFGGGHGRWPLVGRPGALILSTHAIWVL